MVIQSLIAVACIAIVVAAIRYVIVWRSVPPIKDTILVIGIAVIIYVAGLGCHHLYKIYKAQGGTEPTKEETVENPIQDDNDPDFTYWNEMNSYIAYAWTGSGKTKEDFEKDIIAKYGSMEKYEEQVLTQLLVTNEGYNLDEATKKTQEIMKKAGGDKDAK